MPPATRRRHAAREGLDRDVSLAGDQRRRTEEDRPDEHPLGELFRPRQRVVEGVAIEDLQQRDQRGGGQEARSDGLDDQRRQRGPPAARLRCGLPARRRRWTARLRTSADQPRRAVILAIIALVSGLLAPNSSNSGAVAAIQRCFSASESRCTTVPAFSSCASASLALARLSRALLGEDLDRRVADHLLQVGRQPVEPGGVDADRLGQEPVPGQGEVAAPARTT